jgi:hypothetical protein
MDINVFTDEGHACVQEKSSYLPLVETKAIHLFKMLETINPVTGHQVPEDSNLLLSDPYKHTLLHKQYDTMLQWQ